MAKLSVIQNTSIQLGGRIFGMLIMLITAIYIANHLRVGNSLLVGYGQYTIVFAYMAVLGVAADMGLFTFLVREISGQDSDETGRLIGAALGLRFIVMVILLLVVSAMALLAPYDLVVKLGIILSVIVASTILFGQSIASIFQANLATDKIVISETCGRLTVLAGVVYVLHAGHGLLHVLGAHFLGYLLTAALLYYFSRPYCKIQISFNLKYWGKHWYAIWPIAIVSILSLIHFKVDSIILSFLKPPAAVGIYGMSYKLLELVLVIPTIVATNVLPVITRVWDSKDEKEMKRVFSLTSTYLFLVAMGVFIVVEYLAPWVIIFISKAEFLAAVEPLRILMGAVFIAYFGDLLVQSMVATRKLRKLIWPHALAIGANVGLNIMIIPKYSYLGAAWVTVITELFLIVTIYLIVKAEMHIQFAWEKFAIISVAGLIAGELLNLLQWKYLPEVGQFDTLHKLTQASYLFAYTFFISALFAILYFSLLRLWNSVMRPSVH